jgi:hypothetical protein
MRNLVVQTFMTLDGVIQAPGVPEEDPSGGFTHGGWSVPHWDDIMGKVVGEAMGQAVRPRPRTEDIRDLRRPLAVRRRTNRRKAEQRRQTCCVDGARPHVAVGGGAGSGLRSSSAWHA